MTRKKRAGRKPWKPTAKERAKVRMLVAVGTPLKAVATMCGVHVQTLKRACAHEIATAAHEANANVLAALYRSATGADGRPVNVRAAKLFAELRRLHPGLVAPRAVPTPGKKVRQRATAEEIARSSSRFAPPAPPRLAAVDGQLVKPKDGNGDEPGN